jgi:hypothetical protein
MCVVKWWYRALLPSERVGEAIARNRQVCLISIFLSDYTQYIFVSASTSFVTLVAKAFLLNTLSPKSYQLIQIITKIYVGWSCPGTLRQNVILLSDFVY